MKVDIVAIMQLSKETRTEVVNESTELMRKYFTELRDGTGLAEILLKDETDEERMKILESELENAGAFVEDQVRTVLKKYPEMKGVQWYWKDHKGGDVPHEIGKEIAKEVFASMQEDFKVNALVE